MESVHGSPEGLEASTPGAYASDRFEYGIGHYGWPTDFFHDGMFYRWKLYNAGCLVGYRGIVSHHCCIGFTTSGAAGPKLSARLLAESCGTTASQWFALSSAATTVADAQRLGLTTCKLCG